MEKLLIVISLIAYSCSIDADKTPDIECKDYYVNDTIKVICTDNLKYATYEKNKSNTTSTN